MLVLPIHGCERAQGIILGIDRQTIYNNPPIGPTPVIASLWPNSSWTDTNLTPYPYDPAQAKTLRIRLATR